MTDVDFQDAGSEEKLKNFGAFLSDEEIGLAWRKRIDIT